jgi:hypothetical protein
MAATPRSPPTTARSFRPLPGRGARTLDSRRDGTERKKEALRLGRELLRGTKYEEEG